MDKRPTNQEWTATLQPLLGRFHERSARRKLCQLHRLGPVRESKVQCPCPSGETIFATINAQELKIWAVSPDGSSFFMAYDATGKQTQGDIQPPAAQGGPLY